MFMDSVQFIMSLWNFIKFLSFLIYGLATFLFFYFMHASHFVNQCIDLLTNYFQKYNEMYHFIVVGAGSAGMIVATNLAESGYKVMVIEAGGTPPWFADIPILSPLLQGTPYDWQYKTVPQADACKSLINNQSVWPMGKILGGSSRINYMAYVEGHHSDYKDWFTDYKQYADKYRKFVTEEPRWCSELRDSISDAFDQIPKTENYLSENFHKLFKVNFDNVKLTMVNGERWSTDKLINNKNRHNLKIVTHAHVTKIKFNGKEAKGVMFKKWSKQYEVNAENSVIISAGAVESPKLLMLSGIGPKYDLKKLKIPVISDLPVGKNLMDHITTGIDLITINCCLSMNLPRLLEPTAYYDYFRLGRGPWSSAGIEFTGTLTEIVNNTDNSPILQFMIFPVGVSQDNGIILRKNIGIKDEVFEKYFSSLSYNTTISITPVLLHPKSRGEIKLKSSDPQDHPIIDPKYLSHEDDVSTLIQGIKFIEAALATQAMKDIGASLNKKPLPGCENIPFGSANYWECYIRHLTLTSYHPAGTCKMKSVVDNSFRVIGTKKLYVVDASVLPQLPSGNINAAVMMLAEKASTLIIKSIANLNNIKNCQLNGLLSSNNKSRNCNLNDFICYMFHV